MGRGGGFDKSVFVSIEFMVFDIKIIQFGPIDVLSPNRTQEYSSVNETGESWVLLSPATCVW